MEKAGKRYPAGRNRKFGNYKKGCLRTQCWCSCISKSQFPVQNKFKRWREMEIKFHNWRLTPRFLNVKQKVTWLPFPTTREMQNHSNYWNSEILIPSEIEFEVHSAATMAALPFVGKLFQSKFLNVWHSCRHLSLLDCFENLTIMFVNM